MEVDDVDYPLTEKKATKICLTRASLEAHITALKNAGWEVKPPKGTTEQSKIKNQPFGLKLVNPNPQQKKQSNYFFGASRPQLRHSHLHIRQRTHYHLHLILRTVEYIYLQNDQIFHI